MVEAEFNSTRLRPGLKGWWAAQMTRVLTKDYSTNKQMLRNFNMSSRRFLNPSLSFSAGDKRDKGECQISDWQDTAKKGLQKSQRYKKRGICLWMPTVVTEWYHRLREEEILNVNQYTCGILKRNKTEEFGFSVVNVITFYEDYEKYI